MKLNNLDVYIKDLQEAQLEILIEFDRICVKNNIKYQLFAGTLLGAVRHEGFIPWDDDIDICMLRKDYENFIRICNENLDKKYFLQTPDTDKEYIHSFARLRKNNTILLQGNYSEIDMHHGIFIDLFPLDNISLDTILGRVQIYTIYPLRKMKRLKIKKVCLNSKNKFKMSIKVLILKLQQQVVHLLKLNIKR